MPLSLLWTAFPWAVFLSLPETMESTRSRNLRIGTFNLDVRLTGKRQPASRPASSGDVPQAAAAAVDAVMDAVMEGDAVTDAVMRVDTALREYWERGEVGEELGNLLFQKRKYACILGGSLPGDEGAPDDQANDDDPDAPDWGGASSSKRQRR